VDPLICVTSKDESNGTPITVESPKNKRKLPNKLILEIITQKRVFLKEYIMRKGMEPRSCQLAGNAR
jgi:hypothetical protein